MNLTRRLFLVGLIATGSLALSADVRADNALDKLGRGAANGVFGFVEIPATVYEDSRNQGPFWGLTLGWFHGLGRFAARTFVGVFELGTFPIPWPDHYKPYMEPTYAWDRFTAPKETSPVPPPPVLPPPTSKPTPANPAPAK